MVEEKRLTFTLTGRDCYMIINTSGQQLGVIQRKRVGRYLHWCFMPVPVQELGDLWFTNGCMKEISEEITRLYREVK